MKCVDELFLKKATIEDKEEVLKFRDELLSFGGEINGEGGIAREDISYEDWLQKLETYSDPNTVPEGKVRGDHFLTIRKKDNRIVGMVNVRYDLNEFLTNFGGHIGDCVRPTERNQGYATEQIKLAIEYLNDCGVDRILMTCKDTNIASAKSIEKNNGVLENKITDAEGILFRRYWIENK